MNEILGKIKNLIFIIPIIGGLFMGSLVIFVIFNTDMVIYEIITLTANMVSGFIFGSTFMGLIIFSWLIKIEEKNEEWEKYLRSSIISKL